MRWVLKVQRRKSTCPVLRPMSWVDCVLRTALLARLVLIAGILTATGAHAQQNPDPIYNSDLVAAEASLEAREATSQRTLNAGSQADAEAGSTVETNVNAPPRVETAPLEDPPLVDRDERMRRRKLSRRRAQDWMRPAEIYAPLGIRRGGFLLFPELSLSSFYIDNLFRSATNPQSDQGLELQSGLRISSNWSRHALELDLRGTRQFLDRFDEEAERRYSAQAKARLDITARTRLKSSLFYHFDTESRSSQELPDSAAERTRTHTYGASTNLSHRFNRLTLALRGSTTQYVYENVRLNDGTVLNNRDRNYTELLGGLRASYEFSPALTAFADIAFNTRRFRQSLDDDGFRRGSKGLEFVSGIELTVSEKLRGGLAIGYGRQKVADPRLKDLAGLIFEANLEYRPSALTTIELRAGSELNETVIANSAGSVLRVAEIDIAHALRRHFAVLLGASFTSTDYQDVALDLEEITLRAGFDYYWAREVALSGRFEHSRTKAQLAQDNYSENQFRLGLKLRR